MIVCCVYFAFNEPYPFVEWEGVLIFVCYTSQLIVCHSLCAFKANYRDNFQQPFRLLVPKNMTYHLIHSFMNSEEEEFVHKWNSFVLTNYF